jgi:hypothetical protein
LKNEIHLSGNLCIINKISTFILALLNKYIYILSLLGLINTAFAQINFNNRYDFYTSSEVGWSVLEVDSGFLAVSGATDSATNNLHIATWLINFDGSLKWKKSFGKDSVSYYPGQSGSLNPAYDGGYVLGGGVTDINGNDMLLVKFDANLDTVWTSRFGTPNVSDIGLYAIQTTDSGYVFAGQVDVGSNLQGTLIKTDKSGNMLWQQYYGGGGE